MTIALAGRKRQRTSVAAPSRMAGMAHIARGRIHGLYGVDRWDRMGHCRVVVSLVRRVGDSAA